MYFSLRNLFYIFAFVTLLACGSLTPNGYAGTTQFVAITGDAAPDGNGSFDYASAPVLTNSGQATFIAAFTGSSGGSRERAGILRGDGLDDLVQIVRSGDAAPVEGMIFDSFYHPAANSAGQAAFKASLRYDLTTSPGTIVKTAIFVADGVNDPTTIAIRGEAIPNSVGKFGFLHNPTFNDAGEVMFLTPPYLTVDGFSNDRGIFRGDGASDLIQIVRTGDPSPDANGTFSFGFSLANINDSGQGVFMGSLTDTQGGASDDQGIFFFDDGLGLLQVVREGDAAPDANGSFLRFYRPAISEVGQTAFRASLTGTDENVGIFRANGVDGTTVQIARNGDTAPDNNGRFFDFLDPALNNAGQAVFYASLSETDGGSSDDSGLFRSDGATDFVQIAREGAVTPDANGFFSEFSDPAFNEAGQAAFLANLSGTSGSLTDDTGLFFYDDALGLSKVIREGDFYLGSVVVGLDFNSTVNSNSVESDGNERSGLNDLGQVAYRFDLADGRSGIAIWSPRDPNRLIGDFDGSGSVGQGDLALVLQFWGDAITEGLPPDRAWIDATDITGSIIGQAELAKVLQNWGDSTPITTEIDAITAVTGLNASEIAGLIPEPSTAALMLTALLFGRYRRKQ